VTYSTLTVKYSNAHIFTILVLGSSDDESEVKPKNPYKKTTRTSVISEVKNEVSDNGDK